MNSGILKMFDDKRFFGFIKCDDGHDVFVYGSAFAKAGLEPERGMRLSFDFIDMPDGRQKAGKLRPEI
jgi:cold shock CspA family protein